MHKNYLVTMFVVIMSVNTATFANDTPDTVTQIFREYGIDINSADGQQMLEVAKCVFLDIDMLGDDASSTALENNIRAKTKGMNKGPENQAEQAELLSYLFKGAWRLLNNLDLNDNLIEFSKTIGEALNELEFDLEFFKQLCDLFTTLNCSIISQQLNNTSKSDLYGKFVNILCLLKKHSKGVHNDLTALIEYTQKLEATEKKNETYVCGVQ